LVKSNPETNGVDTFVIIKSICTVLFAKINGILLIPNISILDPVAVASLIGLVICINGIAGKKFGGATDIQAPVSIIILYKLFV
jgi:hypothetical protein